MKTIDLLDKISPEKFDNPDKIWLREAIQSLKDDFDNEKDKEIKIKLFNCVELYIRKEAHDPKQVMEFFASLPMQTQQIIAGYLEAAEFLKKAKKTASESFLK